MVNQKLRYIIISNTMRGNYEMEIWKDVKGYENYYEVSNMGRVRRKSGFVKAGIKNNEKRFLKGRILKSSLKKNGYLYVDLSSCNKVKTISVHRLVATAFLPIDEDKIKELEVNHKNCNKQDNRVENLEWATPEENKYHAKANERYKNPNNKKKIRCKQSNMIFDGSYEAAEYVNNKYFGNSKQIKNVAAKIRAAAIGMQKSAYGLTWEQV